MSVASRRASPQLQAIILGGITLGLSHSLLDDFLELLEGFSIFTRAKR
jgi:hypothetical protein